MELDFKTLTMMELRNSPEKFWIGYTTNETFIIERNGRRKACLVPMWYFLPDIPRDKVTEELRVYAVTERSHN